MILFTFGQTYGSPAGDGFMQTSAILKSLTAPGYWDGRSLLGGYSPREFVIMVGSIYLTQGISFIWVCLFEIGNGGALRSEAQRIDLVGRALSHFSFVVPALVLLSLTNNLPKLAQFIQVVYFLQLYPVIASVCMVTCTATGKHTPWFARPSIGLFLVFFLGAAVFANQFYLCGLTTSTKLSDWAQSVREGREGRERERESER